ncbi:MAG: MBL fold metallo-hydrolase [Streptococcaceae bacterium]|jgi:glyoxylase-like metal-dependent hydrolase (beta-lactamase superfamily II)|nr:MBL fold metallo-hydrolase [Streptococcaceae bacterium]
MKLKTFVNQIAVENTYLLTSDKSSQLLIDPGSDLEYLPEIDNLSAVLLTHAHFDHILGLASVREKYPDIPIYLAETEKDWPCSPELNCSSLMLGSPLISVQATDYYVFDKAYQITDFAFTIRDTPGHSIGGVSIVFSNEKKVFSGDTLFKNSIGRTDLPTGNFEQLIHSIKSQLFSLPNDFIVYSGHGEPTTIGEEKSFNPFF